MTHLNRSAQFMKPLSIILFLMALFIQPPAHLMAQDDSPVVSVNAPEENSANSPEDQQGKKASKPAIPRNFTEILETLGYIFVVPFLLASVIAVWFTIERLVVLRRGRVIPKHFVERFLQHLEIGQIDPLTASEHCQENGSPIADIFDHGVRKWGKSSVEVEQAIIDGGERQVGELRRHLRIINGVATVSPLMGLLGTVVGMIEAFNQIAGADAMGKAEQLAVGIATALLTTAAGLFIAIPSLIMYMYLSGKVDSLVMEMDRLAQNVVDYISAEALVSRKNNPVSDKSTPKSKSPAKSTS